MFDADVKQSQEWYLAQVFGACCCVNLPNETEEKEKKKEAPVTHVITDKLSTVDKVSSTFLAEKQMKKNTQHTQHTQRKEHATKREMTNPKKKNVDSWHGYFV